VGDCVQKNHKPGVIGLSQSLSRCEQRWGEYAFKRPEGDGWRDQLLAGMYDAQMLSVSQISQPNFNKALGHSGAVLQKTRELFEDSEFDNAQVAFGNADGKDAEAVKRP
jgi:hypothetical protein